MKKKKAMRIDVRARKDKFFIDRISDRLVGEFQRRKFWNLICKLIRFMDQSWQALRANVKFLALEFQGDERSIHFGRAAIETSCV